MLETLLNIEKKKQEGNFSETCAHLLRLTLNLLTAFSGEEVERQKMFLVLNFFPRKSSQKLGSGSSFLAQFLRN